MIQVAETFLSVNGEGRHAGELAHFIRLSGCLLTCHYCDTAWAQCRSVGSQMDVGELVQALKESPARHVTLTGGEPLMSESVNDLIAAILCETDKHLEIETSGAIEVQSLIRKYENETRLSLTVDRKLKSSGMAEKMIESNYSVLRSWDSVKYVIGNMEDALEARNHLEGWRDKSPAVAFFSPVFGSIDAKQLVDFMKEHRLSTVRLQLQLHKYIWDPQQTGV